MSTALVDRANHCRGKACHWYNRCRRGAFWKGPVRQNGLGWTDPNPRPSLKYQNPPERHEKPRRSAKRLSTRDPTIGSPALETRTLWVQGLDKRNKPKALDN